MEKEEESTQRTTATGSSIFAVTFASVPFAQSLSPLSSLFTELHGQCSTKEASAEERHMSHGNEMEKKLAYTGNSLFQGTCFSHGWEG